jgi:(2Fe-2S) ferredoxin
MESTHTKSTKLPKAKIPSPTAKEAGHKMGVGKIKQHIFLCRGPDCCQLQRGEEVWKHLKNRLKSLGLSGENGSVYRSKVDCLRICQNGPICLVYPEGAWYHGVDESKIDQIIQSHCIEKKSLPDAFSINPLT